MLSHIIRFFIHHSFIAFLLAMGIVLGGLLVSPFQSIISWLPSSPVAVDAIPDLGDNQQIIFTQWSGHSPQDVEDQITYPLTSALLGVSGVRHVRSSSMFGYSSIYVIFEDDVDWYWSRTRLLEKLNTLPKGLLPQEVQPSLGPDATSLGQVFWYTLEGRDSLDKPTGGWSLQELRTIQDFYVGQHLRSAQGVSEVASVGGFVKEYQVDVLPDKLSYYGLTIEQVMRAVKASNKDIGAQTIEVNLVEYIVRGLGSVASVEDIENSIVAQNKGTSIRLKDVASVHLGPATRRGVLDKSGVEAVGGVVVAQYGVNPLVVIEAVKQKIAQLQPGLSQKKLDDGTISRVRIIPFYDRSALIRETIGTLEQALTLDVMITIVVIMLMLTQLKASMLVAGSLPLSVLLCFIAMKYLGVDANVVALSGIAIAIGTMVDMGIVLTDSILKYTKGEHLHHSLMRKIYQATMDVAPAVLTAIATTVISFLPVFTLEGEEGKLFRPLAFTKTIGLVASIAVSITVLPAMAVLFWRNAFYLRTKKLWVCSVLFLLGIYLLFTAFAWLGYAALAVCIVELAFRYITIHPFPLWINIPSSFRRPLAYAILISYGLAIVWMPLGLGYGHLFNWLFVVAIFFCLLGTFYLILRYYVVLLSRLFAYRIYFFSAVVLIIFCGAFIALTMRQEFLPALDEGSFLSMPSSTPHAGMQANIMYLQHLDKRISSIPEVSSVVGKAGRVESALDPAPMSMMEVMVTYKDEYLADQNGRRLQFRVDEKGDFLLAKGGSISQAEAVYQSMQPSDLMENTFGMPLRQWREEIRSIDDIWKAVTKVSHFPGLTSSPQLSPIQTRMLMLQTGMRSRMAILVQGDDPAKISLATSQIETILKETPGVNPALTFAERVDKKPYLSILINRDNILLYGLSVSDVQRQLQAALGGVHLTYTIEGRERYSIRVRYASDYRNSIERIRELRIATHQYARSYIPLKLIADVRYESGPSVIKSEDGVLVGYVFFDTYDQESTSEVIRRIQQRMEHQINAADVDFLPDGITYQFAGAYKDQVRANQKLQIIIPLALLLVFLILYFHFRSTITSLMVFSSALMAFAGGFILLWLYGQPWFLNISLGSVSLREIFHVDAVYLSVAVWVGFLALFGISTDDGVLMASCLQKQFASKKMTSKSAIKESVIKAATVRVRPAMMTTATTIVALLPLLTSEGRGSNLMLPMAIPSIGGMLLQIMSIFIVPLLYATWKEYQLQKQLKKKIL